MSGTKKNEEILINQIDKWEQRCFVGREREFNGDVTAYCFTQGVVILMSTN